MTPPPDAPALADVIRQGRQQTPLQRAAYEALEALVSAVQPAGGCDDERVIMQAIAGLRSALAGVGISTPSPPDPWDRSVILNDVAHEPVALRARAAQEARDAG